MCDQKVEEIKSYEKINHEFKLYTKNSNFKVPVIRLHYGPHECNGFIKHKPQKLHGLVACLRKCNFAVEMIPSSHLNVLKVIILGYEIYRNNIKFLQFNIDCSFDPICPTVLEKIKEATYRLFSNNNIAKNVEEWHNDLQLDLSISSDSESYNNLSFSLQ